LGSYNLTGVSAAHSEPQRTRAENILSCMKMDVIYWVRNHGAICWLAEIRTPRHCLASPTISPQSHIPLLTTLLSFLFMFLFCRSLFKKTKCLKRSTRNMLKICSKRIRKHIHIH